jgi:hypothetical protein
MSRAQQAESSLELLLDTICNTFGGVIFLAILVVILVQMTSRSDATDSPAPSQAELAELDQRRSENQAKLETLRSAAAQQAELIKQFAKPENREALSQLQRMQSSREKLSDARSRSLGQVSQSQMKANEIAEDLKRMELALRDARQALAAAEEALRREMASRTRTARLSVLQASKKPNSRALLLRYGRLFQREKRVPEGFVLNTADCEERQDGTKHVLVLKPSGGKPIKGDAQAVFNAVLSDYDKTTDDLVVVVWPDSFEEFAPLRDAMVRSNFTYDLQPMTKDGQVIIGPASGPRFVQ